MADEEKAKNRKKLIEQCKMYSHVDYDDDAEIVEIVVDAALEELGDLIPNFDADNLSSRQKLLVFITAKELYDNREKYQRSRERMRNAVSSMLLKEIYK
jgi:hypothetical protein